MPIKSNWKRKKPLWEQSVSFSDSYHKNKFVEKQRELFTLLESRPDDLVVKKKMEFISEVLERGEENERYGVFFDWRTLWQDWERNHFC